MQQQSNVGLSNTLLGVSRKISDFAASTSNYEPDPSALMDLLSGRGVVHHVKGYLGSSSCRAIGLSTKARMSAIRSDVPAKKLGADHFGKNTDVYLSEVEQTQEPICSLFRQTIDVPAKVQQTLQRCVDPGMVVRRAEYQRRLAGSIRAVSWTGKGALALGIHDDISQLSQPEQSGFEIQDVRVPVAINMYPVADPNCGCLRVFNLRVAPQVKLALGIEHTGYPFPEEMLESVPFFDLRVDAGDLVLLDGRYLHGVTAGSGERLLLNCFAGLLRDGSTVVTWT